jgi:RNase P protein component
MVGLILTVKDVAEATERSRARRSFRPIATEVFRPVMGWDGAIAGAKTDAQAAWGGDE